MSTKLLDDVKKHNSTPSWGTMSELLAKCNNPPHNECAVKLVTNSWMDSQGVHTTRSILFDAEHSHGYQWFMCDVSEADAFHILDSIVNITDCADGIYYVHICNIVFCPQSGEAVDYSYKLTSIPQYAEPF